MASLMGLLALLAGGAQLAEASATCDQLSALGSIDIAKLFDIDYTSIGNDYWSTGCAALKPSCILIPTSAQEVSTILKTAVANNETFAVKSGGHNPNKYFASIDDGPLISTSALNEVTYNATTNTVRVGPGNTWQEVIATLDPLGVTVVGGRIGSVGVGGYLLGGGLSFLSTQYGWAANNIVSYEIVLPNGTITTASNTTNTDLYQALKFGGSNFGIVTTFTLRAYPIGQIWGGNLIWIGDDQSAGLLSAVRNFTENYDDPKAGIIVTSEMTIGVSTTLWVLFLFYDGETPPAGVFDEFLALDPSINSCTTRSYSDLLTANEAFVLRGSVYTIGTETTPLPPADRPDMMQAFYSSWRTTSAASKDVFGIVSSLALQPIPKSLPSIARAQGGDLLDLDDDVDRIIFELDYSYLFEGLDEDTVDATMQSTYNGLKTLVDGYVADGSLPDAYRPLFMNDAYFREDYWGRLKPAKTQFAQRVASSVDPDGIMQQLTSGFQF